MILRKNILWYIVILTSALFEKMFWNANNSEQL